MGTFSIWHWLVVLLVVVLVFGSGKLVKAGSDVGKTIRGFQKSMREGVEEEDADKKAKLAASESSSTQTATAEKTAAS